MFLVPAFTALNERSRRPSPTTGLLNLHINLAWTIIIIAYALLIGLRFQVGGDWYNYLGHLDNVRGLNPDEVLSLPDPGYQLLNWLSDWLGWDIYGANLIGGTVFTIGLIVFCRNLPRPWLALTVALPYLVIVVAMGYSRQAIALGLIMLGLVAIGRKSMLWLVFCVLLGATFHKTALIVLPIVALVISQKWYYRIFWAILIGLLSYNLSQDLVGHYYKNYIEAQYQAEGAKIRITMNTVPAACLLIWRNRFHFTRIEGNLWLLLAFISIVLMALVFISPSTTAVDRIGLYLLPLQLAVFSHFPEAFGSHSNSKRLLVVAVLCYYATVQFVWLNFATYAPAWLPYQFYPLLNIF